MTTMTKPVDPECTDLDGTTRERLHYPECGAEILAVVLEADYGPQRLARMQWLKENRNGKYAEVLGLMYDVGAYLTRESCFAEMAPRHEQDLYFIGHNAGEFPNAPSLPSMATAEDAYRVAVHFLRLEKLLETECLNRQPFPRESW